MVNLTATFPCQDICLGLALPRRRQSPLHSQETAMERPGNQSGSRLVVLLRRIESPLTKIRI